MRLTSDVIHDVTSATPSITDVRTGTLPRLMYSDALYACSISGQVAAEWADYKQLKLLLSSLLRPLSSRTMCLYKTNVQSAAQK